MQRELQQLAVVLFFLYRYENHGRVMCKRNNACSSPSLYRLASYSTLVSNPDWRNFCDEDAVCLL